MSSNSLLWALLVFCGVLYLIKSGCQWRMLPGECPKWRTMHSYFTRWSEPGLDGVSVLERALKKIGWRGPRQTGTELHDQLQPVATRQIRKVKP